MYNDKKTIETIYYILFKISKELEINKVVKLLYLIDRHSIDKRNKPITYDKYYVNSKGIILLNTFNNIYNLENNSYWNKILERDKDRIILKSKNLITTNISADDKKYIMEIIDIYKDYSLEQLSRYINQLKEFDNKNLFDYELKYEELLKAIGKTDKEVLSILKDYEALEKLSLIMQRKQGGDYGLVSV